MSLTMSERYLRALTETLLMVGISSVIAIVCGLLLAVVLVVTAPGSLYPKPLFNKGLSVVVNMFRSVPFIILLVALIPVTRFVVGTTLGTWAAIVPLSVNLIPFYARIVQVSLLEVDRGLIEAAYAMGLRRHHIIWHVLLAESLPAIIGGMTVCVVVMIGSSAMAGAVGAGGLGDLAIRYGYERYETKVLFDIILILIVMVSIVQFAGEKLARRVDHR
jgi:D-methionine transport system permease protein